MPAENDHDILIEVRTELKALRYDVNEIKDDTKLNISDHETRIRLLEASKNQGKGVDRIITGISAVVGAGFVEIILKVIFHL